jgi:quinoprotein glucose dehydrogenase
MRTAPMTRATTLKIARTLLYVTLVSGFAGCRSAGGVGPRAGADADPTPAVEPTEPTQPTEQTERAPELETVRLDAAEAARLARGARQQLAVELPDELQLDLWAPEPFMTDPIALTVDDRGAVYVTGSSRSGMLLDIRGHPTWTTEALSLETVEDLRAFYHRELAPERSAANADWLDDMNDDGSHDWRDLTVSTERLYRIRDTSGDGMADVSELLYEGFDTEVTDVAGGLHVQDGDIYVAAAPDLWRLRDLTGDGAVDSVQSISHGYSVHPGFFGHGMSGVMRGPDGRIYWSVGDIGFTVVDDEGRRWSSPTKGAILRSEPDGSGFEVFAMGVRNTHEFAFDEYGNLISVDNDGDHQGETERLVYLVDGSDSGWRLNWQFGKYTDPANNDYNVWMEEGLFRPRFEGQAAYLTPPVAAYHAGPSGMVYNPGTALNEKWRDHFFVASFTGTPARSKVDAFRLEQAGAGFELARDTVLISGVLTTGIEFGPEGALYLADWVEGWGSTGSGRVWKLDDPAVAGSELRAETRTLLAAEFEQRSEADLAALLSHADMRVRLKAQFELARRGDAGTLEEAARGAFSQQTEAGNGPDGLAEARLARLHGLWGIGQLARDEPSRAEPLVAFLEDDDREVRAQAAELIGDVRYEPAADALIPLLVDPAPRVRFFAAEALGRIGHTPAVEPLIAMLEANDEVDVYLRHAGTLALARIGEAQPVLELADHPSRALRLAAVVTLRRMRHEGVARFLDDADEYVVTEAARAINDDGSIEAALPALARALEQPRFQNEPLLRRAINANLRVGTADAAQRLASFASREDVPEEMRVEAIAALGVWARPSPLDRVDGVYHGPVEREPSVAQAAVTPLVAPLFEDGTEAIKVALAETAGRLALDTAVPALLARVENDAAPAVRVAAVEALHTLNAESIETAARAAIADEHATVRMAAIRLIPELGLPDANAVELLSSVLGQAPPNEQQSAIQALGALDGPQVVPVLMSLLDQLAAGELAPELELELGEAIEASDDPELQGRLEDHRSGAEAVGPVAAFRDALHGGDVRRGAGVTFRNDAAQCMRCHAMQGRGADVGPDLTRIGATLTREQLLESLIDPSARVAPGFGIVTVTLEDGETVSGTLREETESHIVVQTADGESRRIDRSQIAERTNAPSAMPSMDRILSRREIRDVVEYLSTLR